MRTSVIGLGTMGAPIARNLVAAGHAPVVYSRSEASRAAFAEEAVVAGSAAEALRASDVALLVVPGEAEIDDVLAGVDALDGTVVVTMATVSPAYSARLATRVADAGGRYAEAPMSGSRGPAEAGRLLVLVSGDDDVLDLLDPILAPLARSVVRCGRPPAAMQVKLANNLLLIGLLECFVEATHLATRMGLDLGAFLDVVLAGPLANDVLRAKAPKLLGREFGPEAPLKHVAKDLGLIADAAALAGAHVPTATLLRGLFAEAAANGLAEQDVTAVVRLLESRT